MESAAEFKTFKPFNKISTNTAWGVQSHGHPNSTAVRNQLVWRPRNSLAESVLVFVIPAQAGIQVFLCVFLDSDSRMFPPARPE